MTIQIVELALPDGPLQASELSDPYTTKIGGRPTWPVSEGELLALGLDREKDLKCKACASPLFLTLQMDCPWTGEEGYFDRIMYVFGCNSRICTETEGKKAWSAFVIQTPSQAKKTDCKAQKPQANLWDSIMLGSATSNSNNDVVSEEVGELSIKDVSFYDKVYPVGFPPQRLHICEEMIYEKTARKVVEPKPEDIPSVFAANGVDGEESWTGEAYESSHPMGVDKAFLAFQKRVANYPRQCVRFSPTGTPLPFYQEEANQVDPGTCGCCGQKRVFELQLMPAILSLLPCGEEQYLKHLPERLRGKHPLFGDSMEWGTVMVFTCGTCSRPDRPLLIWATTHTQIETV